MCRAFGQHLIASWMVGSSAVHKDKTKATTTTMVVWLMTRNVKRRSFPRRRVTPGDTRRPVIPPSCCRRHVVSGSSFTPLKVTEVICPICLTRVCYISLSSFLSQLQLRKIGKFLAFFLFRSFPGIFSFSFFSCVEKSQENLRTEGERTNWHICFSPLLGTIKMNTQERLLPFLRTRKESATIVGSLLGWGSP